MTLCVCVCLKVMKHLSSGHLEPRISSEGLFPENKHQIGIAQINEENGHLAGVEQRKELLSFHIILGLLKFIMLDGEFLNRNFFFF